MIDKGWARAVAPPWRAFVFCVLAAMLAGCATSAGIPIASLRPAAGPSHGMARVIVMRREKGFYGWGDRGLPVKVDGQAIGEITTGNSVSSDISPGPHEVTMDLWDQLGTSSYKFNAAPGRTYFVMARVKEKVNQVNMSGAVFGLVGRGIAAVATNDGTGPIELTPLSEAEGRRVVAGAH
jgi:hypothetical protein